MGIKILFVTGNKNKLAEAKAILGDDFEVDNIDIDLPEIQTTSVREVMEYKIKFAYEEASKIHGKNINIICEDTGLSFANMNNLATLLCKRGKYEEAGAIFRETIDGLRGTIGSNHPNTLGTISNFASILTRVGKLGEAESLFREALGRLRDTLGVQNPQTLETMNNFASLLIKQNNLSEAEPLIKELLQINRETLGPKHPETLNDMFSFAVLLLNSERIELAEQLFRETLDGLREKSPEDTRITIIIRALTNIRQKKQGK